MKELEIQYLNKLILETSGVLLTKEKAYLLEARLQPVLQKYNLHNFTELVSSLQKTKDTNLKRDVVEALMTNETLFFRDLNPFEQFTNILLPYLLIARESTKHIRIWSAGCSTGQEPYSLSMAILEQQQKYPDWKFEIFATDISTSAIEKAIAGSYSQFEVQRGLPINHLIKYMQKEDQKWIVKDNVKNLVKFQYFNLLENPILLGKFDIIFCRNVLIYFDIDIKQKILSYFSQTLKPDGFLILGGSESTFGISDYYAPKENAKSIYILKQHENQKKLASS
ncbi:MAG: protein-glutamate O-methyltransferase CheR [Alphaproteobacteria bacterium]|nr:protein-glutamate O-methyltransferase CheR [Alphaproteobacteria bacterium]